MPEVKYVEVLAKRHCLNTNAVFSVFYTCPMRSPISYKQDQWQRAKYTH